jgi:hypothetical protein
MMKNKHNKLVVVINCKGRINLFTEIYRLTKRPWHGRSASQFPIAEQYEKKNFFTIKKAIMLAGIQRLLPSCLYTSCSMAAK